MKKILSGILAVILTVSMVSAATVMNVEAEENIPLAMHTVTFDANGHGTSPEAQRVWDGSTVDTVVDPEASGYTFGGWYKEVDCANAWNLESDTVTGDITLYAKWTAVQASVPVQNVDYSLLASTGNEAANSTNTAGVNLTNAGSSSEDNSSATNEIKIPTITSTNSNTQINS